MARKADFGTTILGCIEYGKVQRRMTCCYSIRPSSFNTRAGGTIGYQTGTSTFEWKGTQDAKKGMGGCIMWKWKEKRDRNCVRNQFLVQEIVHWNKKGCHIMVVGTWMYINILWIYLRQIIFKETTVENAKEIIIMGGVSILLWIKKHPFEQRPPM